MSPAFWLSSLLPGSAFSEDACIEGLAMDSRDVRAGDAFAAVPGILNHGLCFAQNALAQGAATILYENPVPETVDIPDGAIAVSGLRTHLGEMAHALHGRPSEKMTVVAVTGTNGKTSVVQLLAQAWEQLGWSAGSMGTLGVQYHGAQHFTGMTTRNQVQNHVALAQMYGHGIRYVAMEASSHALDQGRMQGIRCIFAVFTNLTRDHLDYHGSMENYAAAKARLFQVTGLQFAVVNFDDPFSGALLEKIPDTVKVIGTSMQSHPNACVKAEFIKTRNSGFVFDLLVADKRVSVNICLLGLFNIQNMLSVVAVLHAQGVSQENIAAVLARLQPVPGRMSTVVASAHQPLVVVDYAHTPDGLAQALDNVSFQTSGRMFCVFGCGGERDRGKRALMGKIAEERAQCVILTDDNPRGEDGNRIIQDIMQGMQHPQQVIVARDRTSAIAYAISRARYGDSVLIAGKGHEQYQEISGQFYSFDDVQTARVALKANLHLYGEAM